jgi:hypothetical protein
MINEYFDEKLQRMSKVNNYVYTYIYMFLYLDGYIHDLRLCFYVCI